MLLQIQTWLLAVLLPLASVSDLKGAVKALPAPSLREHLAYACENARTLIRGVLVWATAVQAVLPHGLHDWSHLELGAADFKLTKRLVC